MDNWDSICGVLSLIFEQNRPLNFDISLSPEQVSDYLTKQVLYARLNSTIPSEIEAAFFVTVDGECGFIALRPSSTTYKHLVNSFKQFVIELPQDLSSKLWCRVQKDNLVVQKLLNRLRFVKHQESDTAFYYVYKGG